MEQPTERLFSKTIRSPGFWTEIVAVTGPQGEWYKARVFWNEELVRESELLSDPDTAEQRCDMYREQLYREKLVGK